MSDEFDPQKWFDDLTPEQRRTYDFGQVWFFTILIGGTLALAGLLAYTVIKADRTTSAICTTIILAGSRVMFLALRFINGRLERALPTHQPAPTESGGRQCETDPLPTNR